MQKVNDTEYISKDAFVEQQRKQYCENFKRRKGIKNGKEQYIYAIGETPCRACDIEDMIDAVWDFLPADVAPVVHGHWIEPTYAQINQGMCGSCEAICSVCGFVFADICMKYCPECGAKMDERSDKE